MDASTGQDEARSVLERMVSATGAATDPGGQEAVLPGCALAVYRGRVPVGLHRNGAVLAAVQGHVQWASNDLATLAASQGMGAAAAAAYARHGVECLQEMRGPFALAIADARTQTTLLAVDRMGIRTLCYAASGERLVFGSTADCVIAHPAVQSKLSEQAIFNYLYCHMVPSPGTIYEGVEKLLPGECLIWRQGVVEKKFYWRLEYHGHAATSVSALEQRFHDVLRESVGRAADGLDGERIGAFLSGGTDSSTVAGILTEVCSRPVDTYSIGFAAEGFDEMGFARIAARHFGTRAHEYYVTPQDVVDAVPLIASSYDEPFGNDSAVPTYYCAKLAKEDGVNIMLAGDGGDEIFGGNARYAQQKVFEYYGLIPKSLRSGLIEPMLSAVPGGEAVLPVRKLRSYIKQANIPLPDRLESYNFLHRLPLSEIFEPDFFVRLDPEHPLQIIREAYNRTASASTINRMLHLDLKQTLADNDMRKVSRMCERAGVEVRYPLIDEALVQFAAELPPSLKVKGLKLRYFFKHALRDFLPREIITKSKHGFGLPFGLWVNAHAPLADMAQDSLEAFQRRGYMKRSYIDRLLAEHRSTHATYFGKMIWAIMMLEQWLAVRGL